MRSTDMTVDADLIVEQITTLVFRFSTCNEVVFCFINSIVDNNTGFSSLKIKSLG